MNDKHLQVEFTLTVKLFDSEKNLIHERNYLAPVGIGSANFEHGTHLKPLGFAMGVMNNTLPIIEKDFKEPIENYLK